MIASGSRVSGRYELLRLIGRGGNGEVWEAYDRSLMRSVAIKLLAPESEEERERIWREARLAGLITDVAVPIYDFGDDGESCFLVMELVKEPTLAELLTKGALNADRVSAIAFSLLAALEYIHKRKIVHRDIKPENVFIDSSDTVRLVDFGLAFSTEKNSSSGRLTKDGSRAGTPAYLSPEQAQAKPIGTPSDIYSAGCVIHEMVAGAPPFHGSTADLLTRHIYAPPIALTEIVPDVSPVLSEMVAKMMQKDPADRPSASKCLLALSSLRSGGGAEEKRIRRAPQDRVDRMVSRQAQPSALGHRTATAQILSGPPWLLSKFREAGIDVVNNTGNDSILVSSVSNPARQLSQPQIAWMENGRMEISEVIRLGFDYLVTPTTPVPSLVEALHQLTLRMMARKSTAEVSADV